MPPPSDEGVDADRKIQVLKKAVIKLTREKAELEERVAVLSSEVESRKSQPTPTDTGSSWRKLFAAGAAATSDDAAAPGAKPGVAGLDPAALSDLLKENERLHVDLFDQRKAFESVSEELKVKVRNAEASAKDASSQRDRALADLAALQAGAAAEHEAIHGELVTLRHRLSAVDRKSADCSELSFGSIAGPSTLLDVNRSVGAAGDMDGVSMGHRLAVCIDALLLLAGRLGVQQLETVCTRRQPTGSDWDASPDSLRATVAAMHTSFHACVLRARAEWKREAPLDALGAIEEAVLVLHDQSDTLWRAVLLAGQVPTALGEDGSTRSGARSLPLAFDASVSDASTPWKRLCVAAVRMCKTLRACAQHDSNWVSEISQRPLANFVSNTGSVADVATIASVLISAAKSGQRSELGLCATEAAEALTAAVSQRSSTARMVGESEKFVPPTWLGSAATLCQAASPARCLHTISPSLTLPPARQRPSVVPCALSDKLTIREHSPSDAAQQEMLSWVRAADRQCVFWRRQFELALVELDERTNSYDRRTEEVSALKVSLEGERREREFQTGALQRQIQVLSEQLVEMGSAH
jgi:hypothetical protein